MKQSVAAATKSVAAATKVVAAGDLRRQVLKPTYLYEYLANTYKLDIFSYQLSTAHLMIASYRLRNVRFRH